MSASSSGETAVDTITLSEHDTSRPLDLSETDLQAIDAEINQERTRLEYEFTAGGNVRLRTSSHVGVVSLPSGRQIRIRPKAAGENFLRLLLYAQDASPDIQEPTVDAERGTLFIDAIGALFLEHVESILHQGLAKEYRREESREQYLRGRLDVQRQLSRGSVATTRFDVEYSNLTHNTLAN